MFFFFQTRVFQLTEIGQRNEKHKQVQPYINKMLTQYEKKSRQNAQLKFLFSCKKQGVVPKGLRSGILKSIVVSNYGSHGMTTR